MSTGIGEQTSADAFCKVSADEAGAGLSVTHAVCVFVIPTGSHRFITSQQATSPMTRGTGKKATAFNNIFCTWSRPHHFFGARG